MSFKPGDRVFAKIKGFSNWPARINPLPSDVAVPKGKLPVFFYGTYQVSFVPTKNVVPYEEFKEKWGKPKSNAQFMTAIEEIESNPGVLMLGEDPSAESFLSQFYTFKKGGSGGAKRRRLPKVTTSKKDSPLISLSSTKSDITAETSDALSTNDSKWDNNGTTESGVVDTLSEVDDDEISLQAPSPDAAACSRDQFLGEQYSYKSVETLDASDDREARKVARKLIKKAEKKALKKAAKREAKRIARESKRAHRRARREAKLKRRRDTADRHLQTSGSIAMNDAASQDTETELEMITADLYMHDVVEKPNGRSVPSSSLQKMQSPGGTSLSLTWSPKMQPCSSCSRSPSISVHSPVRESPPSLEPTDFGMSSNYPADVSPSSGYKDSPPSSVHPPFLADDVITETVLEAFDHAANNVIQESTVPQDSLSPLLKQTTLSPETEPRRITRGRRNVKRNKRGITKERFPASEITVNVPTSDSETVEVATLPTRNMQPPEAPTITTNSSSIHQLDLTAEESPSPCSAVSHLKHICHELKGCLIRGHERFQLAVEFLTELATLQVRLPQLAQARELMDCVKKCRRYKLSTEVRDAAEKVLQHFQTIRSLATKDELAEAHLLLMVSVSAQPEKSQPSPPHPTVISVNQQPPTILQTNPEAPPAISSESENLAADLDAKVDDVLSRIRATDERMAAAARANATISTGNSSTVVHKPAATVGHTIRASAVAAAAAHMHDEEDEEEVMSRIELVAAFQAASKEVSHSPREERPADTKFQSLSPPVDLDLDSRIEKLRTSSSSSSKLSVDSTKLIPNLSSRGGRPPTLASNNMDTVLPSPNSISLQPEDAKNEASVDTTLTTKVGVEKDDELYDLLGV